MIRQGEGLAMSGAVFGRTTGWRGRALQYVPAVAFAGLAALGTHLVQRGADNPTTETWIWFGAVMATAVVYFLTQRVARRVYLRSALSRGEPPTTECDYQLTEEGLRLRLPGYLYEIDWDRISQIALHGDAWLFIAAQSYFLPRRLFADGQAERDFLHYAVQRLSEEARDRSLEALEVRDGIVVAWKGYGKG